MSIDSNTGLRVHNYKPFAESAQGFDRIARINVIIGRNNTGKSALLDIVDYAVGPQDLGPHGFRGKSPAVEIELPIAESVIEQVFPRNTSGGPLPGNHFEYGAQWIDTSVVVRLEPDGKKSYVRADPEIHEQFKAAVADRVSNPFQGYLFRRVLAERNITPEGTATPSLAGNGQGATNVIQYVVNDANIDSGLVERQLLAALNQIFEPDATFDRIRVQRLATGDWEIYLDEEGKGTIALSSSGSGLKTVIQVLLELLIMPQLADRELSTHIFGFEELENNLHPGLQRRLFAFLRELAVKEELTVFITTHSNVVIDLFSTDPEAQIIHVVQADGETQARTVSEHQHGQGVLDDLDVRASDLLQANGILWVEGPSDRIYLNHFLGLLNGNEIREGAHYQCVFYGGRLLARLSAEPDANDLVNLLRVNRHCCLVMDRDTHRLNATKTRMKQEVEAVGGHVWVTAKKEIECSIPLAALEGMYGFESLPEIGPLEPFDEYLDRIKPGEGRVYLRNKVLYAERVLPYITKEMLGGDGRLVGELKSVATKIRAWNRLAASA